MSSPLSRFRVLPIVCTGVFALLGGASFLAGSKLFSRPAPAPAPGVVAAMHSLRSSASGVDMMYVSLPGIGTAVMSLGSSGKPTFCPVTLHRDELTFSMDGHLLDLSGIRLPVGSSSHPTHLLMHLDRGASRPHVVTVAQTSHPRTSVL